MLFKLDGRLERGEAAAINYQTTTVFPVLISVLTFAHQSWVSLPSIQRYGPPYAIFFFFPPLNCLVIVVAKVGHGTLNRSIQRRFGGTRLHIYTVRADSLLLFWFDFVFKIRRSLSRCHSSSLYTFEKEIGDVRTWPIVNLVGKPKDFRDLMIDKKKKEEAEGFPH